MQKGQSCCSSQSDSTCATVYDVQTIEMGLMPETRAQQRHRKQEEQAVFTLAVETEIEPSTPFDIPGEPRDTPEQQEESVNTSAVERDEQPRWEEEIEISVEDKIFPLCWLATTIEGYTGI